MINLLKSIVDTVSSFVSFVISSISSLVRLFLKIPDYLSFVYRSLFILPDIFYAFVVATILIYVLYLIIGRNMND